MPLTLRQLMQYAEHAAGDGFDGRTPAADIVNAAGQNLAAAHDWQWLARAPVDLASTAGQGYTTLPSDFAELEAIHHASVVVHRVDLGELALYRKYRDQDTPNFDYYVAVGYEADTAGAMTARLEIWPAPSTTETNLFQLVYRAGWLPLAADTDVARVPVWIEPLLIEYVRVEGRIAAAGGGSLEAEQLRERLGNGQLMRQSLRRDGATQVRIGRLRGGGGELEEVRRRDMIGDVNFDHVNG